MKYSKIEKHLRHLSRRGWAKMWRTLKAECGDRLCRAYYNPEKVEYLRVLMDRMEEWALAEYTYLPRPPEETL